MAERGYAKISDLPIGTTPLTGTEIVEIQAGEDSFQIPFSELGGAPSSHATSHQNGGSDEIANSTPGAGVIPKADGSGTLNDWISPATTTTAGKVVLAADGESSAAKPPASNDSRLSDARYPTAHGSSHTNGADQIPNATPTTPGLMSAADKAAFDAYDPENLPGDGEKAALAGTYGTPSDTNRYVTDDDPRLETLAIGETLAIYEKKRLASIPDGEYIDRILFNGVVYVSRYGGDIYTETGGALVGTGQTSRNWMFFEVFGGELYCTVDGGDIYKMDGSGVFQATGQASRSWQGIKSWNGGLYAVVLDGDLYLMDGSGVFQPTGFLSSTSPKFFAGLDVYHVTGNLVIARDGGTCLKVTTGGVVSSLGNTSRDYADVCDDGEKLWAVTSGGLLYCLGYPGDFHEMYQYSYPRRGISFTNNQRVVLGTNSYNDLLVESHEDKNIIIPHGYVQMGSGFAIGNDLCIRSTEGDIYVDLRGDKIDGVSHLEIEPEGFVHIQKISSSKWAYCSSSNYAELSPSIPAIRVAALIDETKSADVAATYAVVSNVCTITLADHGHLVNHIVYLDFTSGDGVDGWYIITGVEQNTFTVSMTVADTSGNVTLGRRVITKGYGIHSACGHSQAANIPAVVINFTEKAPDSAFWYSYGCGTRVGQYAACVKEHAVCGTTSRTPCALALMGISNTSGTTWGYWCFPKLSVQVFW